ncbi:MAG: sugar ABC transporter permease [Clostridiales bacterium]|nr:sugar ABC transporter permease [Clostridiales bacterium]
MDNTANNTVIKKKRGASLTEKKSRLGWVFIAPFIAGLILFYISIVFNTVQFSFSSFHTNSITQGGGYYLEWVGIENYKYILTTLMVPNAEGESVMFLEVLATSILNQFVDIITIILLSLFVAVLLNQKMVGRALFRAIFFVPVVIGAGIIAKIDAAGDNIILEAMSNGEIIDTGAVNDSGMSGLVSAMDVSMLFSNLGIGTGLVNTVVGLVSDIYEIVNRAGVQMLIFLAGLQSISPAIYESAQMEGATGWETFWKITFPMISPMILANSVYTVIDSLTSESNTVMVDILAIEDYARQSAASVIYFVVIAILLSIVALICTRFVFYQRRND